MHPNVKMLADKDSETQRLMAHKDKALAEADIVINKSLDEWGELSPEKMKELKGIINRITACRDAIQEMMEMDPLTFDEKNCKFDLKEITKRKAKRKAK